MRLATLAEGGRDGTLALASSDLKWLAPASAVAPTLQAALDDWAECAPALAELAETLEAKGWRGASPFDPDALLAPLPRAYQFLDGSAYLHHVELARRARGAEMPESFLTDPLMYQGVSAPFLGPRSDIAAATGAWGLDFEAELAVIVDAIPQGTEARAARARIRLVTLLNDVSLRGLIPGELAKGFGFLHGKPLSALAPLAVSPEELGTAWDGAKLHLPVVAHLNGTLFGEPNAGRDMQFDFGELVAHAARTRPLVAGTIIGSGTISNRDPNSGACCIVERRMVELLEDGEAKTPFLQPGDRTRIEVLDQAGRSVFGALEQTVSAAP